MVKSDPVSALMRQYQAVCRERDALKAEIEDWRARLATQCGHTLAMQETAAQIAHRYPGAVARSIEASIRAIPLPSEE